MKRFKVTRKGPASYDKNDIRLQAHTIQVQACTIGLIILEQRQLGGDLIKVFKIICGFENVNFCGLAKICRDAGTVDA